MRLILRNTLIILNQHERTRFLLLIVLDILISFVDIAFLALLLIIVQFYTQAGVDKFSFLPSSLLDRNSLLLIVGFFMLFSLKNLAGFLIYRSQCRFLSRVSVRVSKTMLQRYQEGNYLDYVNIDSAIHIRKISHQPIEFSYHILAGIQQIVTQLTLIIFSVTAILIFNAKIFLLLLVILMPPVIAVFYLVKRKLKNVKLHMKKSSDQSLQHLQEALSGFVESNIYNRNEFFLNRYAEYQERFNSHHSDLLITQAIPSRMIEVFALFGLFVLIALNKWSGNPDGTTVLTIGAFMAAAYKIIPGIVKILNSSGQINTYSPALFELAPPQTGAAVQKKLPAQSIQSIGLNKVSFGYKNDILFKDLTLQVKRGDFMGLSGLSGKGKTTIVNLLLGFLTPDSGQITVNEQPAKSVDLQQYWPAIAYVKQQSFLLHDTVLHNISLNERDVDHQKLNEVIKISGLTELINSFAEGIDSPIMEGGKNISGGQRQRIALARALYKDVDLIILDEPFNELDEKSEHCLLNHFKLLAERGKLIILITHNQQSLSFCNKILSLDEPGH